MHVPVAKLSRVPRLGRSLALPPLHGAKRIQAPSASAPKADGARCPGMVGPRVETGLKHWAEWREDKENLERSIAPEGPHDSAQGFNPVNRPERAADRKA
jgi:hypothetical protein